MKKIFTDTDKFDRVTYSESYSVEFSILGKDGYTVRERERYFAASKGSHLEVERAWTKKHPAGTLISVKYE